MKKAETSQIWSRKPAELIFLRVPGTGHLGGTYREKKIKNLNVE